LNKEKSTTQKSVSICTQTYSKHFKEYQGSRYCSSWNRDILYFYLSRK